MKSGLRLYQHLESNMVTISDPPGQTLTTTPAFRTLALQLASIPCLWAILWVRLNLLVQPVLSFKMDNNLLQHGGKAWKFQNQSNDGYFKFYWKVLSEPIQIFVFLQIFCNFMEEGCWLKYSNCKWGLSSHPETGINIYRCMCMYAYIIIYYTK